MTIFRRLGAWVVVFVACTKAVAQSSNPTTFNTLVTSIMVRPDYRHAFFGIEIYSIDRRIVLFELNGQKLFTPGSTTKLLTEGTALQILGGGFRFHTAVYRTAKVHKGSIKGDLVLVASGDPNLSDRIQKDGTLAFADEDHSYGGFDSKPVSGDPLAALNDIAEQIAAAGIHKINGRILVDASLFPEGERELGTGVVISPISVNDNVIDVVISPGQSTESSAIVAASPQVPFIRFINKMRTGVSGSKFILDQTEATASDGVLEVTLAGNIPPDRGSYVWPYPVASPSRFAAALLAQALRSKGVLVMNSDYPSKPTGDSLKSCYTPGNRVADFVSRPLSEEVKVTLKVSQNLHAGMTPFVLGALVGNAKVKIDQRGFQLEHDLLAKAGLDLTGASQSDGAGGASVAFYTPDFIVRYLDYMASQPNFKLFRDALPILGRDGTLFNIQTGSAAAGLVFAKTGTSGADDLLNDNLMLSGKGLAGYTTTVTGEHVAFALYVNHVSLPSEPDAITATVGQALGEIAAGINLLPIEAQK
jgi:PBP4 family serine-type D-alanyl-D-alanine carboxypeptidase